MKFQTLAEYFVRLERTDSRNKITEILADLINQASIDEIPEICYLSIGQLGPFYQSPEFNLAEKTMLKIIAQAFIKKPTEIIKQYKKVGDLGDLVFKINKNKSQGLKVKPVFEKLLKIAKEEGTGSQERKAFFFSKLLKQLSPLESKYIVRIPVKKLRLGFSELTLLDALSWSQTQSKNLRLELERAYNIKPDIGELAKKFKQNKLKIIKNIQPQVGIPIKPALAERLQTPEEIVEKLGTFGLEPKYDGFRLQIHLDKTKNEKEIYGLFKTEKQNVCRLFSRRLDDMSAMFPEVVNACQKLSCKKIILDSEVIGYNEDTDNFLPFQETAKRKRKYGIKKAVDQIPVKVFIFDLLYLDGQNLIPQNFSFRREKLEKLIKNSPKNKIINLTPQHKIKKIKKFNKYFNKYVKEGLEGIMAKKLDTPYQAGARNFDWVKYKRAMKSELADTVDCLIMGYYIGKGRRSDFGIGAFLVGILDPKTETFKTLAKIGTGVTDNKWLEIKRKTDKFKTAKQPKNYDIPKELKPDVLINPELVVEIEADEITKSPLHSSKFALRFPRMKRFRDKRPNQITTLEEIKQLNNCQ